MRIDAAKRVGEAFETFAMSNCKPEVTGLPNSIFIWIEIGGDQVAHGPRIKVSNVRGKFRKEDTFSVSIPTRANQKPAVVFGEPKDFTPAEMRAIFTWVTVNQTALVEIWRSDIMDDTDARKLLKKI